jgi:hypothetical protein
MAVIKFLHTFQIMYYSINIQVTQPHAKFLQNCKQDYKEEGLSYSLTRSLTPSTEQSFLRK